MNNWGDKVKYYYLFLIVFIIVSFITGVVISIIEKSVRREFEMDLMKNKLAKEKEKLGGTRQVQHLDNFNDKVIVPIEVKNCDYNVPVIVANIFEKTGNEEEINNHNDSNDVSVTANAL